MNNQVEIQTLTITPDMAREYLAANTHEQRRLKQPNIDIIAHEIKAGRWVFNGASIAFDTNGHLIDGQHRLAACVKANAPIITAVVTGLAPASFTTIDSGKSRGASDVLTIAGYNNSAQLAATVNNLLILEKTHDLSARFNVNRFAGAAYLKFLDAHPDVVNDVKFCMPIAIKRSMGISIAATMLASVRLTDMAYYETCMDFILATASGPNDDSPAHMLRDRFIRAKISRQQRMSRTEKYAVAFIAWRAWAENRAIKKLRYVRYGVAAMQFPAIYPRESD